MLILQTELKVVRNYKNWLLLLFRKYDVGAPTGCRDKLVELYSENVLLNTHGIIIRIYEATELLATRNLRSYTYVARFITSPLIHKQRHISG